MIFSVQVLKKNPFLINTDEPAQQKNSGREKGGNRGKFIQQEKLNLRKNQKILENEISNWDLEAPGKSRSQSKSKSYAVKRYSSQQDLVTLPKIQGQQQTTKAKNQNLLEF